MDIDKLWPKHAVIETWNPHVGSSKKKKKSILQVTDESKFVIIDTQRGFMDVDENYGKIIQWSDDLYVIQMVDRVVLVHKRELPKYLGIHESFDRRISEILKG